MKAVRYMLVVTVALGAILMAAPVATSATTIQDQKIVRYVDQTVNSKLVSARSLGLSKALARLVVCHQETKKTTAEGAGFIDLFFVKQILSWCTENVHGVNVIKSGPWFTQPCAGREHGIASGGINWNFAKWVECRYGGGAGKPSIYRYAKGLFKLKHNGNVIQQGQPFAWVRGFPAGGFDKGGGGV